MEIKAEKVKGIELKAGDLFSTASDLYWKLVERNDKHSIGEKVYIRTTEPCPKGQENEEIYRLIINPNAPMRLPEIAK